MTDFDKDIYESKCKTCRRFKKCLWLAKKKKKETCCGVFYVLDIRKIKENETV